MDTLQELQRWYRSQCDGDWEHGYGIEIRTLDNPGWHVVINLEGTYLEGHSHSGTTEKPQEPEHNWIHCQLQKGKWKGSGGPFMLNEILQTFLAWSSSKRTSD